MYVNFLYADLEYRPMDLGIDLLYLPKCAVYAVQQSTLHEDCISHKVMCLTLDLTLRVAHNSTKTRH